MSLVRRTQHIFFFFKDTATPEIYTLPLPDALPIGAGREATSRSSASPSPPRPSPVRPLTATASARSEEHTSELQSRQYLVCRLLLEKKKNQLLTFAPHTICSNLSTSVIITTSTPIS